MKALTFKRYGKSPEIGFADVPRPTLKADELLVQVHAASVNPIDNMIPTGHLQTRPALPASGHAGQRSGRCGDRGRQPRDPLQAGRCGLRQHLRPGHGLDRRVRGGAGERCRAEAGQPGLRAGGVDPDGRAHLLASAEGARRVFGRVRRCSSRRAPAASARSRSSWQSTSAPRWERPPAPAMSSWCAAWAPTRWSTTRSRNSRRCCAATTRCWAPSGVTRSRSPSASSSRGARSSRWSGRWTPHSRARAGSTSS